MIARIGVLGAGVMGGGIAQVTATAGFETRCYDPDPVARARGLEHATTGRYGLARGVERGKLTADEAEAARARLTFVERFEEAVSDADLVIEAVPERLDVKIRVFRDLDRSAPAGAVLASNTSGLPITALGAATDRPEQVVGWHWASPAVVMRFAEIVRGPETSDETIAVVREVATRCGKNPIVVRDQPQVWGFVANRVYFAAVAEARRIVDEGIATAEDVDQLVVDCFRWPVGPLAMVGGATAGWE
jgi:3-hydroxyacyl-CoA dehydrogenase